MQHIPIVATTLKRPVAMRSISSSICCSEEEGELRRVYVGGVGDGADGFAGAAVVGAGVAFTGGRRENSDGEGAMKERYWSKTWSHQPHGRKTKKPT